MPRQKTSRPRQVVTAVLRDEPQYRLLFTSQVLSILGDRVTAVVLPFALLALPAGVWAVACVRSLRDSQVVA